MSISAVDGYGMSGMSEMSSAIRSPRGGPQDPEEFASSIMEQDDTDGDGLLSLGETPLDEDRFNSIDADGDGYLSREELSDDFESHMEELMNKASMTMQSMDPSAMAQAIVDNDDTDGDGMLSQDETPLDDDRFSEIDADGDGLITADELSADAQEHMAEAGEGMMASPPPMGEMTAGGGASSGSGESQSEEEYDAYDLNQDGQVSLDELLQAFRNGDSTLDELFGDSGNSVSSQTQRLAMDAYAAQSA